MTLEEKKKLYARLIIEVGLHLNKGDELVISSPVDCAPFARLCTDAAYDAGCRDVTLRWVDDYITRQKYLRAEDGVFSVTPEWMAHMYNDNARRKGAWLSLDATDPSNLEGVDGSRLVAVQRANGQALKEFYDLMDAGGFAWCIAALPIPSWSKKVFAGDPDPDSRLWDAIFSAVRIYGDGSDPVGLWREHLDRLQHRRDILNKSRIKSLHYENSLGTDLTIELPADHVWEGGADRLKNGTAFVPNLPTEEIFTAPLRTGVNGRAVASRPLVLTGNVVENFEFIFRDGKITELRADKGEQYLRAAVTVDEGASYLGEVSLVPYDSPISNTGILFYNTLFDENAACHLAFGRSYPNIVGGLDMTREQLAAHGLNDSITHKDFMIGTADLSITATTLDGGKLPIFENGNFVF